MVARRRGDLIFVGSDVGLRQRPHMGAYGAAKAGLAAMVTNLQMELKAPVFAHRSCIRDPR